MTKEKIDDKIQMIIEQTVNETVVRLKKAGIIRDENKSAFKKTEQLLRSYNSFKQAIKLNSDDTEKTKKIIDLIDNALIELNNEQCDYPGLIERIYFDKATREELATEYDCEPITITRNKNKMVKKLQNILFSDNAIEELFLPRD